jgi:rhodanese-related sulfurtransferase
MRRWSNRFNNTFLIPVLAAVAGVIGAALLIYLTPLKHANLISPTMHEVDPAAFEADFVKHPDDYIFIDVRSPNVYQSAHAKGSINIPIENLYDEHYTLPKSGKKIVLICTTGRLAAIAYGYLQDWGFTNLLHLQGGLQNWTYEGLPIEGQSVFSTSTSDSHQ